MTDQFQLNLVLDDLEKKMVKRIGESFNQLVDSITEVLNDLTKSSIDHSSDIEIIVKHEIEKIKENISITCDTKNVISKANQRAIEKPKLRPINELKEHQYPITLNHTESDNTNQASKKRKVCNENKPSSNRIEINKSQKAMDNAKNTENCSLSSSALQSTNSTSNSKFTITSSLHDHPCQYNVEIDKNNHVERLDIFNKTAHENNANSVANINEASEENIESTILNESVLLVEEVGMMASNFGNYQAMNYKCASCGMEFRDGSTLKIHLGTHRKKKFKCNRCAYVASNEQHFSDHMLSFDHGKLRHKCNECNYAFFTLKALERHKYFIHIDKKFTCNLCKEAFISIDILKIHYCLPLEN